jgi:hypothetical protein
MDGIVPSNPKHQKLSKSMAKDASGCQIAGRTSVTPTYSSHPEDYNGDNVELTLSNAVSHHSKQASIDSMSLS